ncbi:excinuclease ABC subunit UvrA [Clostridium hydrogenum]|uniref:excinuclease ABC subunit UvrA n=1 Tax=Clostridium hydrogenum TaxID=2855764 RepID=UPI001F3E6BCF|nr:excinuclease ABC subunit UvrA [Clostridium hydrogenum]
MKEIKIHGARAHNLKNINVCIPKNKLVVVSGVSGSGKSSLAFDIVFEEGRKQYLKALGILNEIDNESKFDSIEGLGPTIAVQQNILRQSNPRSTVGSRTGIINMLALLYAGEGQIICSSCGTPVDNKLICKTCGNEEERLKPSYFSYNSSEGMCMKCSGRGAYFEIKLEKLVPDKETTLEQVFYSAKVTQGFMKLLRKRFQEYFLMPFWKLPEEVRNEVVYGQYENGKRSYCLIRAFQSRYDKGEDLAGNYTMTDCSACHGFRVGEEARRVFLNGKHIGELGKMTISELQNFLEAFLKQRTLTQFGENLLKDILAKTNHLIKFRLGHLSLYREMSTLSGGEIQRLFLNSHLESKLNSLIYVLDEPTAGLHEAEKLETLKAIKELKELGNTVIIVEHDKNAIKMAEHIIDIGPKAGNFGGQLVYQGNLEGLLKAKESITGQYLSGKISMPKRKTYQNIKNDKERKSLTIRNANTNNLNNVTVTVPLGAMVGIAGKSGCGKSSLISDTLLPLIRSYFNSGRTDRLEGMEHIAGYAEISQAPIGKNMNSTPASYIGILDKIRILLASEGEAVKRKFTAGHFSFNSKGACAKCGGSGFEKIWLTSNLSINKICTECQGKRFNTEALSIKYRYKNIYDILEMTVSEAVKFFQDNLSIVKALEVLEKIGMGYIKLGQPAPTLSGGEAQRIKLAKELSKRRKGNILYVLDEPTTGLSLYDTAKLIELLDELIEKENSVIVIEHNIEVLKNCDWIVELGPEGGQNGGYIIAEGSPKALKENSKSITGRYL